MKRFTKVLAAGAATLASVTGAVFPSSAEASFLTPSGVLVETGGFPCAGGLGNIVLYETNEAGFGRTQLQYRVHTVVNGVWKNSGWTAAGPAGQTNYAWGPVPARGATYSTYIEFREYNNYYQRWSAPRGEWVLKANSNGTSTYYCRA